jgi:hypothetical protein
MEIWACGHLGPLFLPLFVPFNVQRLLICLFFSFVRMVDHLIAEVFLYPCALFLPFVRLYMRLSDCFCLIMIDFNLLGSGFFLLPCCLLYLMMFLRPLFLC